MGHERGSSMMSGMCPMQVPGTTVAAADVEGGVGLSFTTTTGDVTELRRRVAHMAEMHNQHGGQMMMGGHGTPPAAAGGEHQHGAGSGNGPQHGDGAKGHAGSGMMMGGGMMGGGGMMMPPANASVEDIEGGARLVLRPKDAAQLGALRDHVRMTAERMSRGECPMMSLGGGEPAAPTEPGAADHDAHHPGK